VTAARAAGRSSYDGVAVAVPVTVPYRRYSTHGAHWWIGRAMDLLVERSGIAKELIDGLTVSSFSLVPDTAVGVTQHLGVSPRWLDHIPTGGASGVMALRRAARAVQAGDADDASYPYGSGGPNSIFAFITAAYMRAFGAEREDFGRICVAQRVNALRNPNALFKVPLTIEQYLDARPISDPIHLFDCVMPCAGAEAFLVMREERAKDLGLAHVLVRGAIERHNAYADDPVLLRGGWRVDRDDLYAQAGVGVDAIDFVQTYDDYPVVVMLQFEDLGFCEKGEGPSFVRTRTLTFDGDFPNNTSGGQLSAGQAGCAGGFLGMTEAIRQLTGEAGERAVADARLGLVSGFGMVTYDRCLCTGAVILGRSS
jgi:acetyl-CoA acetyltransferase